MAVTLTNLLSGVSSIINQSLADDTLTVTKTEVTTFLNFAYKECVSAIIKVDEGYYMRQTKANLVSGQSLYTLPTDARKLDRLELAIDSSSSTYYRATKIHRNAINNPQNLFDSTHPLYCVIANGFEIFPVPTANVTNGINMWYYEAQTDLSSGTDEINLPIGYEHLPILYAGGMAKLKLGLQGESDALLQQFNSKILQMQDEIRPRSTTAEEFVIIRNSFDDSL